MLLGDAGKDASERAHFCFLGFQLPSAADTNLEIIISAVGTENDRQFQRRNGAGEDVFLTSLASAGTTPKALSG